jgi:hypothetical protein
MIGCAISLPLGISIADGSGGETVTVAGLAEGTELSLGTALESGSWLVPVADLDKTFVGAPTSFVGAMTAKVILNSPTGKRLDTRTIRFEWSKPKFYSAPPAGQTEALVVVQYCHAVPMRRDCNPLRNEATPTCGTSLYRAARCADNTELWRDRFAVR